METALDSRSDVILRSGLLLGSDGSLNQFGPVFSLLSIK